MTNPVFQLLAIPVLLIALAASIAPAALAGEELPASPAAQTATVALALRADVADSADAPAYPEGSTDAGAIASAPLIVSDLYSSIESADITVLGDVAGTTLHLEMIFEGRQLMSRELPLEGPGTVVTVWPQFEAEKGSYEVCASLPSNNGRDGNNSVISRKCFGFYYGGVVPIRFDVRDFRADSRGMHLAISASDPTVVDIYYMLLDGNQAVYITREQAVTIAGSYSAPIIRDYAWKQILENGRQYTGRVKIVELNHNQSRAFMNSFTAVEDALITETYQDETGASATVLGNSRVPFEGSLRFILSQNGKAVNVTEKKTPILLSGDDETVEISWNETLPAGVYQLSTILINSSGSIMDLEENVIEAEPIVKGNATVEQEKSPFPGAAIALAMLMVASFKRKRQR